MGIQEIKSRITKEAEAEAEKIKQQAAADVERLKKLQQQKIASIKAEAEAEKKRLSEEVRRSLLVPARLKAKNDLLQAKQDILGEIYNEIKKEKKISDPEISRIREQTEIKTAEILFSKINK